MRRDQRPVNPRRIHGEGPIPCQWMIVRDSPGREEARSGKPFAGRSGQEFDRWFDGVRLPARGEVYCTSWIKDWREEGEYAADDYSRDLPALLSEISEVQPQIIIAVGRAVSRLFLGDVDLDEVHGIPWQLPTNLFTACHAVIVPVINPAAGYRSPQLSALSAYDFSQLEGILQGVIPSRKLYDDPFPTPYYEDVTNTDLDVIDHVMDATSISVDSEGYAWAPWSVQITADNGEAFIIRYRETHAMARFADLVNTRRGQIIFTFHNALHDLAVFRALGIDTTRLQYHDTMVMAYVLQLEPQGLKPLATRHCGMRMQHFEEVMGAVSFELAQDWLLSAQACEDDEYQTRCRAEFQRRLTTPYTDAKGRIKPGRRLTVVPKLAKTDLHRSIERCLRSANPRKLWGDQVLDRHVEADPKYGPMWEATLDHIPRDHAIHYAGRDADATHRLKPQLLARIDAADLRDVYDADMATVPLIDRMQQIGLLPDLQHFARLSEDLALELVEIKTRLADRLLRCRAETNVEAAFDFNPNSTQQVAALLHDHFQCDILKRTPDGDPSTNDKVLEALERDQHLDHVVRVIIADIRSYRETYKLKYTFTDAIPAFVNRWPYDARIHPTYRITRVVSGRLASSDPNVLALPKHGKFAKRFRQGFICRHDARLASWDLNQIELRVLAHLSQDPVLLHAYRSGVDLHATVAQRIFGVEPKNQDDSRHRLPAKAVNFGIPMGMTNIGLCLELRKNGIDVSEDDAQRWLNETLRLYREVPVYQQAKIAEARRYGFVTDLRGRRRYIGGIRSWDDATKSEAERFAFATPIQAGAQEIMHEAEAWVYQHILLPAWHRREYIEPLLQIHDDLVMEADHRLIPDLHASMIYAMTQVPAHWLSVPIGTKGTVGLNWGEMYAIKANA